MPFRFTDARSLASCINDYFTYIEGDFHMEEVPAKATDKQSAEIKEQKVWDRQSEPPALSSLAYFLGFDSRQAFETYEAKGKHANQLKRARLRIEAEYEKKLHYQSCSGAIFALKNMGWNERPVPDEPVRTLQIQIVQSGPEPAGSEQEVTL